MTCTLFEHLCHIALHIEILNTIETQQQKALTVSEEAQHGIDHPKMSILTSVF
jgi:hypothetical protein